MDGYRLEAGNKLGLALRDGWLRQALLLLLLLSAHAHAHAAAAAAAAAAHPHGWLCMAHVPALM